MMDNRLRSVLTLAFRPDTPMHEAEAALHAARRLLGTGGIEALLAARERIVERVVERPRKIEQTITYTQTIPMRFQHNWLEIIIQTARRANLDFELIQCGTVDNKVIASMEIKYRVGGLHGDLDRYDRVIQAGIKEMERRAA